MSYEKLREVLVTVIGSPQKLVLVQYLEACLGRTWDLK